jgi:hypothetical protein
MRVDIFAFLIILAEWACPRRLGLETSGSERESSGFLYSAVNSSPRYIESAKVNNPERRAAVCVSKLTMQCTLRRLDSFHSNIRDLRIISLQYLDGIKVAYPMSSTDKWTGGLVVQR